MNNKKLLKIISKYIFKYKHTLFLSLFFTIIYVVSTLTAPIIVGRAINLFVYSEYDKTKLLNYIYILIADISLGFLMGFLMGFLLNKLTYKVIYDLRKDTFNKILNVEVRFLDSNPEGDLMQRIINDTDTVADGLLQGFSTAYSGIITIVMTIVLMMMMNWILGLVVVILTPLSFFVAKFITKHTFQSFKKQAEIKGDMMAHSNEMITYQKICIAYQMQEDNVCRYEEKDEKLYNAGYKAQFFSSLTNPSTRFVNNIVYAIVAITGCLMIIKYPSDTFKVGQLTAFLTYASQYTKPFNELAGVATELSNSFASLKRIFELMDEKEMDVNNKSIGTLSGDIKISNVKFGYNKDKVLINNLNLDIKRGMHIAIVGPTGCGKTTLINLLMRFYEVDEGSILYDSKNSKEYSKESLRDNIGMVLQDTWVFKGSIMDNIMYAKKDATKEEVIEACKRAYSHDFIIHMKDGYDTIISNDDSISEGQKQLLCISRLMLRNPNILILDEATSSIDTRTEVLVGKAFNNLMEGHTTFIIAHRLSTIKNADLILVMKDGDIIEKGNHESLINEKGFYYTLYNSQFN